jgi:hypothetical protein
MSLQDYKEEVSKEVLSDFPDYFKISDMMYKIAVLSGEIEERVVLSNLSERASIQKICLERELKRSRDQDTYLGLEDIMDVLKKVLHREEIKLLKFKL